MLAAALPPPLPTLQLSLAPWLLLLSMLGGGLALGAWRAGIATPARALLGAGLPATLWLLLAALNPAHPTRLTLAPLGAGLASSFCCGLLAARTAARRASCSTGRSVDYYLWSCAAALLGGRLFHLLEQSGTPAHASASAGMHGSGLSASGALLGAMACLAWCFRDQPLRGRAWLDALAPALALALALSGAGAYLQQPTHVMLGLSGAGLVLAAIALVLLVLQRFHGQAFVLTALGYGIVQLSVTRLDSARAGASGLASVASWLVIGLAIVAGWVWRKGFTSRGI